MAKVGSDVSSAYRYINVNSPPHTISSVSSSPHTLKEYGHIDALRVLVDKTSISECGKDDVTPNLATCRDEESVTPSILLFL